MRPSVGAIVASSLLAREHAFRPTVGGVKAVGLVVTLAASLGFLAILRLGLGN